MSKLWGIGRQSTVLGVVPVLTSKEGRSSAAAHRANFHVDIRSSFHHPSPTCGARARRPKGDVQFERANKHLEGPLGCIQDDTGKGPCREDHSVNGDSRQHPRVCTVLSSSVTEEKKDPLCPMLRASQSSNENTRNRKCTGNCKVCRGAQAASKHNSSLCRWSVKKSKGATYMAGPWQESFGEGGPPIHTQHLATPP